jgi:small subunit ribosomal protein S20
MPVTKSAQKALRQNLKRKARNIIYKTKIKKLLKEANSLISLKKIEEVKNLLPKVYQILDKAVKRGVIKKNTAARKKSRIAKALAKISI